MRCIGAAEAVDALPTAVEIVEGVVLLVDDHDMVDVLEPVRERGSRADGDEGPGGDGRDEHALHDRSTGSGWLSLGAMLSGSTPRGAADVASVTSSWPTRAACA